MRTENSISPEPTHKEGIWETVIMVPVLLFIACVICVVGIFDREEKVDANPTGWH